MAEKCHYCGIHDIVPRLIVANACRSCARLVWRQVLVGAGRPDPGPHGGAGK